MVSHVASYRDDILDKLSSTTEPLNQNLLLNGFGYRRFYHDGTSLGMCTNRDWDISLDAHLASSNVRLQRYEEEVRNTLYREKYISCRIGIPFKGDFLCQRLYDFNIWNSLCIYYKTDECVESFYFTSTKEKPEIIDFYLNNLTLLEKYIAFFKRKFAEIVSLEEFKRMATQLIDPKIFKDSNKLENNDEKKVKNFAQAIGIDKFVINKDGHPVVLSKREAECLCYMAAGKTMKEIAFCLSLSARTVEFYIDNMKKKTGLCSKSQLINLYFSCSSGWTLADAK